MVTLLGYQNAMDPTGLNLVGLDQEPVRRNDDYRHRDQLKFYGTKDNEDQFRICYRFKKDTVRLLMRYTKGHDQ